MLIKFQHSLPHQVHHPVQHQDNEQCFLNYCTLIIIIRHQTLIDCRATARKDGDFGLSKRHYTLALYIRVSEYGTWPAGAYHFPLLLLGVEAEVEQPVTW